MKKTLFLRTAMLLLTLVVMLCASFAFASTAFAASVELSADEAVVYRGKQTRLTYTLLDVENPQKAKIVWTTSDKAVATVNAGTVVAVGNGQAEITCTVTLPDGAVISDTCVVTVRTSVAGLALKQTALKVEVGAQTEPIQVTINPANASCQELIFASSDESIATVDENGVITGVKAGTANITITSADDSVSPAKKIMCKVTVTQPVVSVTLDEPLSLAKGKTAKLNAVILPEDATNKKLTWTSSDPTIVAVQNGNVTARAAGTATITVTAVGLGGAEITASTEVTVFMPVAAVTIAEKPFTMMAGSSSQPLTVTVKPDNAAYQQVIWTSDNPEVATVDENGVVTALKAGKVKITATSAEPTVPGTVAKAAFVNITVQQPAKKVTLSDTKLTVGKGKTAVLTATVLPEDATNKKVTWTTSNPTVATVDANGRVSGRGTGTAIISCTTADGTGLKAVCAVTVIQAVNQLKPSTTQRTIVTKGRTASLSVTVLPNDATNKKLEWTSSNNRVATVANGMVTAVGVGDCEITASATDGSGKSVTFKVAVEPSNPVTISDIDIYYYYRGDWNCLFVTPYNNNKYRTVKTFRFDVKLYDRNGKLLSSDWCEWSGGGFRAFGPGKYGQSGNWHWYDFYYITRSYKQELTVTSVTYMDGTTETIPLSDRVTSTFYY